MSRPEVDLKIDGIQNTHRLSITHEDHKMDLDVDEVTTLIQDLVAGRNLLLRVHHSDHIVGESAPEVEEPITWHREKPGTYFSHPTPDITLKAERIKGTKAWIARRNGKIVARDLSSYAAAKEVLRDGVSSPP